jgi:L-threonylcarbamoyladenylate synthase
MAAMDPGAVTTDIDAAVAVLRAGGVVGLPTETVYGLAARAADAEAVRRVFAVKGRPADHPLIVHLPDASHLDRWAAKVPTAARMLADTFWPGPLTMVLEAGPDVPAEVTGGRLTVAVRVPAHPVALAVLAALDDAVAAPSANRFGRVSPTCAAHVAADLGDEVDLVLDGGPCAVGVESTIVDLTGEVPQVLRTGAVTAGELSAVLGVEVATWAGGLDSSAKAPGMLASHYAPDARVVVVDEPIEVMAHRSALEGAARIAVVAASDALLDAVEDTLGVAARGAVPVSLEPVGDADGFARHLYDRLRQADRLGCDAVVVVAPAPGGMGDAVRDRLERAARGSEVHPS